MKITIIFMVSFITVCFVFGYYNTENKKLEGELSLQTQLVRELSYELQQKREVKAMRLTLDYAWPIHVEDWTEGELSSPFGERPEEEAGGLSDGYHEGLDLWGISHVNTWRARVCAVADGWVEHWLSHPVHGEYYLLHHDDGNKSAYHHLSVGYILDGERVVKGQVLGRQGDTGLSDGIHLHFELEINDELVNPLAYLSAPWEINQ